MPNPKVFDLCSTIQNASRANLRRIAVPYSNSFKAIGMTLLNEGLIDGLRQGDTSGPFDLHVQEAPYAPTKLWIDLKYRLGQPVISSMKVISKPSRRIFASHEELVALASCRSRNSLLKNPVLGSVVLVKSPYGIVSLVTAIEKGVGGEVLCVAS